jgi:pimeloyl-ACP methyl ester carboxylesterase
LDKTIMFIHGAWVTPLCWKPFESFFQGQGYTTVSPPWPGKDRPVVEQQEHPSSVLQGLGIGEIVAHYEALIKKMPSPPILVGHSFGGLFVQLLLDRGIPTPGVAIDSAPPQGIFAFYPTAFRSLARVLTTWRGWQKIVRMPFSDFCYAFLNMVPPERRRAIYDEYVVPETGRIFFQEAVSLLSSNTPAKVNFKNSARAPLLLVAGGSDHIVPPQINRSNFKKFAPAKAITAYKEFPGRSHWIIAQDGWEEVASYIFDWLSSLPSAG